MSNNKKIFDFAGYKLTSDSNGLSVHRKVIDTSSPGDYGCDPLPDGKFRMVPSGDIVDREEKEKRLTKRR